MSLVWQDRLLCLGFPGIMKQSPLEPRHLAGEMQRREALTSPILRREEGPTWASAG